MFHTSLSRKLIIMTRVRRTLVRVVALRGLEWRSARCQVSANGCIYKKFSGTPLILTLLFCEQMVPFKSMHLVQPHCTGLNKRIHLWSCATQRTLSRCIPSYCTSTTIPGLKFWRSSDESVSEWYFDTGTVILLLTQPVLCTCNPAKVELYSDKNCLIDKIIYFTSLMENKLDLLICQALLDCSSIYITDKNNKVLPDFRPPSTT